MRDVTVMVASILFFSLPPVAVALWPKDGEPVVVLATRDTGSIVAAADGAVLSLSDDHEVAVTRPRGGGGDFLARLRAAGAGLVLAAPDDLACLATPTTTSASLTRRDTRR